MQSVWPRARLSRPHIELPQGSLPAFVLVLLLTIAVANSTVAVDWVPGSIVITRVALLSALLFGGLALVRRIPWPVPVAGLLLSAYPASVLVTQADLIAAHPQDPHDLIGLMTVWLSRAGAGTAASDTVLYLHLMALLFWLAGDWLNWYVLRWGQPLVGRVAGALAYAANILNY